MIPSFALMTAPFVHQFTGRRQDDNRPPDIFAIVVPSGPTTAISTSTPHDWIDLSDKGNLMLSVKRKNAILMDSKTPSRQSPTVEDYLQSIYSLETEGERVISARLARWMRVTPPTAWATVQRLRRDKMVEIDGKKTIRLTPHGRELAESVARRHRLSERFLTDIMDLGWAEAHVEAQQFEHGVTPVIERQLVKLLNNPTTCPHGSPIPGTGATLDPKWMPLDKFNVNDRAEIKFISEELEEDTELLQYLDEHSIRPGQQVSVTERVPSNKLLLLNVAGEHVSLGLAIAARIRALPL
jgi:DtxR family Mn-dependent transcriptional regulator